jgi:hypothetical protein
MNHCDRCGLNWLEDGPRTSEQWINVCPRCQSRDISRDSELDPPKHKPQSAKALAGEAKEVKRHSRRKKD